MDALAEVGCADDGAHLTGADAVQDRQLADELDVEALGLERVLEPGRQVDDLGRHGEHSFSGSGPDADGDVDVVTTRRNAGGNAEGDRTSDVGALACKVDRLGQKYTDTLQDAEGGGDLHELRV